MLPWKMKKKQNTAIFYVNFPIYYHNQDTLGPTYNEFGYNE